MGIKNYVVSFTLSGIAILLIIIFAVDFQNANNSPTNILSDNQSLTYTNDLGSYFVNYSSETQDVSDTYYNTTLKEGSQGDLYVTSQGTITTKSWKTPYAIVQRSMVYAYQVLIGDSKYGYIFTTIVGLLAFIGVMYFIKNLRQGQE